MLALGAAVLPPGAAQAPPQTRTEQAIESDSPDARIVAQSYVRLHSPLPAGLR